MAITVVQSNKSTSTTCNFASNTTAGNCVIALVCSYLNTTAPSVTGITLGGVADNFTQAVSNVVTGISGFEDLGTYIWYDWSCAGGVKPVVVSGSATISSSGGGLFIYEVAGLTPASSTLDQTNNSGSTSGGGGSYTSGSVTTLLPNEIVLACAVGGTLGSASGFTSQSESDAVAGYQIVSSTGSYTYTGTDTSAYYSSCIASFSVAPGGGLLMCFP